MAVTALSSGTKTLDLSGTVTVTIASPGVFTYSGNHFANGDQFTLTTTGALPTGLTAGTIYYVVQNGTDGSGKFRAATSPGGSDINTSGSQSGTHTIFPEQLLAGANAAGTYTLHVDASALAAGDILEARIYQMVLTGGARRVAYYGRWDGAQPTDDLVKISVPISNELTDTDSLRFTLKQTRGTSRAVDWKVLKYA